MKLPLKAVAGLKIHAGDGWEEQGFPEMMSTAHFYLAEPGDKLTLLDKRYKFNVATYAAKVEDKWVYTYAYAPNQAWVVYNGDLSKDSYRQETYVFEKEMYFRLCLRRQDGSDFADEDINDIIAFEKRDALRLALLTDSHYVVNGTWDDTFGALWAAHRRYPFDGIVHLGDITDGMLSKQMCYDYAGLVLDDLKSIGVPVWVTLGNHDSNYFHGNADRLTVEEQCALYLDRPTPRYHVDFPAHRLRLMFLDSYDPQQTLRYGYASECIAWADQTLSEMPCGWQAVIFSHLTPMARLQVWVEQIRGEDALLQVLTGHAGSVLAFINGHQHADILCNELSFPTVTVGCAKCECETVHKPKDAYTPERKLGDRTQELWDILCIDTESRTVRFKRQGAGKDRIIKDGRAEWI